MGSKSIKKAIKTTRENEGRKDVFFVAKKEVVKKVGLQIQAGKANPAPPVGTVLGPLGN